MAWCCQATGKYRLRPVSPYGITRPQLVIGLWCHGSLCDNRLVPGWTKPLTGMVTELEWSKSYQYTIFCCAKDAVYIMPLQWHRNGLQGFSSHPSYSIICSGADQRKHQSSASLAFVRGIHWCLVNSLKRASNAEKFSIWWCQILPVDTHSLPMRLKYGVSFVNSKFEPCFACH